MQALLLESEKAVKAVIDSIGLGNEWPCKTSFGNDFDETQNQILVETEGNAEEVIPNTGVYTVTTKVAVYEAAPDGDTNTTASALVFNRLCNNNLRNDLMVSSSNKLFVYNRTDNKPSFNNAEVGDSWQQVLTFQMDCCLTADSI